jgi:hypothetical protein
MVDLPTLLLINALAVPVVALIDYVAFRKRVKDITGQTNPWYFVLPCALELWMFNAGLVLGASMGW